MRKINSKGQNYQEQKIINFSEDKKSIFRGLSQFISSCDNKKGMPQEFVAEWEHLVKKEVETKINACRTKQGKSKTKNNILRSNCIKNYLEELDQKFIVTSIDNGHGNIGETFKRFCALTRMKK